MSGLSAIAAAAGIAGNFLTSYMNHQNDLELLRYQNEYNSPKNMMKRLAEAGINPNAAAQGIAGSPGYGNMAAADAANVSPMYSSDLGSMIGNSVNSALNAELVRSNIRKNNEQTRGMKTQNDYSDVTFETRVQQAEDQGVITHSEAQNAKLFAEKYPELLDLQYEQASADLDKTRAEKRKIEKDIQVSDKHIAEIEANIKKLEQDVRTAKSQEAKNYAEASLARANKELADAKAENQELRNRNMEISGDEQGWKAQYFAIEDKDGKDAADSWLETNMEITDKVVRNSSKASAESAQDVVDNTPQGRLKRMYQERMNKELAEADREIEYYRKKGREGMAKSWENEKNRIIRKYRNKMRRVDKGTSVGGSAFGFGLNAGG